MDRQPNFVEVVIAAEQPAYLRELRKVLEIGCGFNVLGEATDMASAAGLTRELKPDVLVLDQTLMHYNGFRSPMTAPVRILAMLNTLEKSGIVDAFQFGAHGIVLKNSSRQVFSQSVQSVFAGHYWLGDDSIAILVDALRESLLHPNGAAAPKDYGLTCRELEIINKIVSGRSNKEVGEDFSISERTVKHHLTNIFDKVGVSSRLQLALFALDHQLFRRAASASPSERP